MKKIVFILVLLFVSISCTDNIRTKNFGGTLEVKLQPNEEFINITWKNSDLWIIVKDKNTGIHYARENSTMGLLEGTIIIK